jgi:hypothetical protein
METAKVIFSGGPATRFPAQPIKPTKQQAATVSLTIAAFPTTRITAP